MVNDFIRLSLLDFNEITGERGDGKCNFLMVFRANQKRQHESFSSTAEAAEAAAATITLNG